MIIALTLAHAAELLQQTATTTGVTAELSLEVTDGRARLVVVNQDTVPFVVDWEASTLSIGGTEGDLIPGGTERPDPEMIVAPAEVPAGERISVRPVPRAWLVDGEANDAEQWKAWSDGGEVALSLVVSSEKGPGTVQATWTTQAPVPKSRPLAVAATVPLPTPQAAAANQYAHIDWERKHRSFRRQERFARLFGFIGGGVGIASFALAGLSLQSAQDAPIVGTDDIPSQSQLKSRARGYAVIGGVGMGIAIPCIVWDITTRQRRKKLGPRP